MCIVNLDCQTRTRTLISKTCNLGIHRLKASRNHAVQVKWLHARSEGCHPLAFDQACRHGHLQVAKWLKAHCSRCQEWTVQKSDPSLQTFIHGLGGSNEVWGVGGHLEMLKWLLQDYVIGSSLYSLMEIAVIAGSQECLDFLLTQPEKYHHAARQSKSTCRPLMKVAARHGRLGMLPALSKITGFPY